MVELFRETNKQTNKPHTSTLFPFQVNKQVEMVILSNEISESLTLQKGL